MSASLSDTRGSWGAAVCRGLPGFGPRKGPRLVLGGGAAFADRIADHFRRLGWEVCTAPTTDDAVRLALRKNPSAVVIPTETGGESGYLTCAKLRAARPKLKLVLVGPERSDKAERFAGFVGAAFVAESTPAEDLARLV